MRPIGPEDASAAVFVFKTTADRSGDAWGQGTEVDRSDREANSRVVARNGSNFGSISAIRREHHQDRASLLDALHRWNDTSRKQFLMLIAHGVGCPTCGISPTDLHKNDVVSWDELAGALTNGVEYLVLVGCRTLDVGFEATSLTGTVRKAIIGTTATKEWGHLIPFFSNLISMGGAKFVFDDGIRDLLHREFDPDADVRWFYDKEWHIEPRPADDEMPLPDLDYRALIDELVADAPVKKAGHTNGGTT